MDAKTSVGKLCLETLYADPKPKPTQALAAGMALLWRPLMERHNGVDRELGIQRRWKEFGPVFESLLDELDEEMRDATPQGPGKLLELPSVDPSELTPEAVAEYMRWPIPLVIRRWAKDTRACRDWSPAFFKERYGATQVHSNDAKDNIVKMPMRDTIDRMESDKSHYIANVSDLMNNFPDLERSLELEGFKTTLNARSLYGMQMFIGPEGRGTSLHAGAPLTMFMNIHGSKEWLLINPRHGLWMRPNHQRQGHHSESPRTAAELLDLVRYIPVYRVALKPGDILLNPPWWWHQVRNLEGISIACSVRIADHSIGELRTGMFYDVARHTAPFQEDYIREIVKKNFAPQRMSDEAFLKTYDNLRTHF